jgi:hypothetical protein
VPIADVSSPECPDSLRHRLRCIDSESWKRKVTLIDSIQAMAEEWMTVKEVATYLKVTSA